MIYNRGIIGEIKDRISRIMPDKIYLSILFRYHMGYWMDWNHPLTFSEKLQWLKIHDRNPLYTKLVDKYTVKEYVASIIGKEYIIPTLGVWDRIEDIEWDKLPQQFVLKTNHGGGSMGVVICRDKASFDKKIAIKQLKESLKTDLYVIWKEWPYKNVPKRIIAEQYIQSSAENTTLNDYKIFCFNGEPKYCQVISGRDSKMSIDFFDFDWNHQPFHEPKNYPFADKEPRKPLKLDDMRKAARKLSHNKSFCRIDFYESGKDLFFGEITFYPTSGFGGFLPKEYDKVLGDMISLSQ